jgi:hypothetical protein
LLFMYVRNALFKYSYMYALQLLTLGEEAVDIF